MTKNASIKSVEFPNMTDIEVCQWSICMTTEVIGIGKVADMLDISGTGVKSLIKNGLLKTQNNQVLRQSVLELIDKRDDALTTEDILKYLKLPHGHQFYYLIKTSAFPKHDFKIGKLHYWEVDTVRNYL